MSTTKETDDRSDWIERGVLPWSELNTSGTILDANGEPILVCLSREATQAVLSAVNSHAANVELIGKLADLLRYLRDTAFAFHLNEHHKPDAFSSCKHHVCQRACQAWNEATKALADQKGRD